MEVPLLLPFNAENLAKALKIPNLFVFKPIEKKQRFDYLHKYLLEKQGLGAKTIVVEESYNSLAFAEDYGNYYSSCFRSYSKAGRRVHFFKSDFDSATFRQMVLSNPLNEPEELKALWDSYLGFIFIKPLPAGIIGTTILKPYGNLQGRCYTVLRDYNIHIFGRSVTIKSLCYEEQDGIIGSCATTALLFAFHKTNDLFSTPIPAPSQITISAGVDSQQSGKIFPSNGLGIPQICRAISQIGLVSEVRNAESINQKRWLKAFCYSYLRMGLPILLGIDIETKGAHLVTLTGYRFSSDLLFKNDNDNTKETILDNLHLKSDKITKLYAHDDQVGPFSRLEFDAAKEDYQFRTSWWSVYPQNSSDYQKGYVVLSANTKAIIVPIIDKIKVSFEDILTAVYTTEFILNKAYNRFTFEWDIFLIESHTYKSELKDEFKKIKPLRQNAEDVLFQPLPKYIWVAKASISNYLVFDMIFDATDLKFALYPYISYIYNESFHEIFSPEIKKRMGLFNERESEEDWYYEGSVYNELLQNHELSKEDKNKLIDAVINLPDTSKEPDAPNDSDTSKGPDSPNDPDATNRPIPSPPYEGENMPDNKPEPDIDSIFDEIDEVTELQNVVESKNLN